MSRHKLTIEEIQSLYPDSECSETHVGGTPYDDGFSVAYFCDEQGNPAPKEKSTLLRIHVFDPYGKMIDSIVGNTSR